MGMTPDMASFREVQRFRDSPVVRPIVIGVAAAMAGAGFECFGALGLNPQTIGVAAVLAGVGFILLFGELRTEVHADALCAQLFPLTRRHRFSWHEIASFEARTYRPILEYGGWGIRYGTTGKAYNVRGNRGVQLEFTDGKRLLIGSQQADELAAAMQAASGRR